MPTATSAPALFNELGRRIPAEGMRVYGRVPRTYYRLVQPEIRFDAVLERSQRHSGVSGALSAKAFESACRDLKLTAEDTPALKGLFNGIHVPFVCPKGGQDMDLGTEFEQRALPAVCDSFAETYPRHHFRATLQGKAQLVNSLRAAEGSRYDRLLKARRQGTVAGWYFPTALQEFDLASQRAQMSSLPLEDSLVLSGGFEAAAALTAFPGLLMNEGCYPPVLCLSAFKHTDDHLMVCFKSYGPNLEFWCMSQMLTPKLTQVSEQWAGGLTLFTVVD